MHPDIRKRLEATWTDFTEVTGSPFTHFFCPILFRDDKAGICRAHIVNLAFRGSTKRWVIQRADVDNFHGSVFESRFVQLRHRGKRRPEEFFSDPVLGKHFRPRVLLRGQDVGYYLPRGPVPPQFSQVTIDSGGRRTPLALKIEPAGILGAKDSDWQFEISADLRLDAVGSLLKAAYLTLFKMLGYRYALSSAGHLLGYDALGRFFLDNQGYSTTEVRTRALTHFREFANMVRPIVSASGNLKGTASDRLLYLCRTGALRPWALLVIVRTGASTHGVMAPCFEEPDGANLFLAFLKSPMKSIEAHLVKYENDRWLCSKEVSTFHWPSVEAF